MNPRITGLLCDLTSFLTIVAIVPYEFGPISELFPPDAKKWVAGSAAVATVVLRIIKRVQTSAGGATYGERPAPTPPAPAKSPETIEVESPS